MNEPSVEILSRDIEPESGHCWCVLTPAFAPGDKLDDNRRSKLALFEDGKPLGPPHALHDDVRKRGGGLFSHWGDTLYFSTSDNSDPRSSGRKYTITGTKRAGYVPHKSVLRGYEVIPTFIGTPFLDPALVEEMENHLEAAGKSSWGTRNVLQAFVLSLRPKVVLEIGSHIGSASVVIGAALKVNNSGVLYCLEPQEHYYRLLVSFVERAGLNDFVQPLQLYSTSPKLSEILKGGADLIYLDANHSYSNAFRDLQISDQLLNTNGLLLLDDVGPEASPQMDPEGRGGVRQALLDFTKDRSDLHAILLEPPFWLNPVGLGIVCKQTPH